MNSVCASGMVAFACGALVGCASAPKLPRYAPHSPEALSYPNTSIRLGEVGWVLLGFRLDEHGIAHDVTVLQPSGFLRLDDSAVKILLGGSFEPGAHGRIRKDVPYRATVMFCLAQYCNNSYPDTVRIQVTAQPIVHANTLIEPDSRRRGLWQAGQAVGDAILSDDAAGSATLKFDWMRITTEADLSKPLIFEQWLIDCSGLAVSRTVPNTATDQPMLVTDVACKTVGPAHEQ